MILEARQITKSFAFPELLELLKGIDLQVQKGEAVAIMGRSGEGKSTLLHILGTLDAPSGGFLAIASQPVTRNNNARLRNQHIGFIFQSFHLLEEYTVLQNVLMPARIARKDTSCGSAAYKHAEYLLEHVGLSARTHHFAKQLSGGEKQRAAIARALCNNPDLLLADEPSGNLDRKTAEGIHQLLLEFTRTQGKGLIVVTHDAELASLCTSLYTLQNGVLEKIR
jgi:lipoprotein-releasing system ATP-binding protein